MADFILDDQLDITTRPRIRSLFWIRNLLLFFLSNYVFFKLAEGILFVFPGEIGTEVDLFWADYYLENAIGIDAQQFIMFSSLVSFWLTSLLVAVWFNLVYANLKISRLKLNGSVTMAAVGCFIPIINFVHPFFTMSEAWLGSLFLEGSIKSQWRSVKTPFIIYFWWISFLLLFAFILMLEISPILIFSLHYLFILIATCSLFFLVQKISKIHINLHNGTIDFPIPKSLLDNSTPKA